MSLLTYFHQLQRFNPLTQKEFLTLLKKAQKGNKRARNKIVEHNLRLVVFIAKKYGNTRISIDDLVAEGNLGLFEAIRKFDHKKYKYFSTFAFHQIKAKISRYIDTTINLIRVPQWAIDLRRKLIKKPKRQSKKIEQSLQWGDINMVSLQTLTEENTELLDFLGTTDPITDNLDFELILESIKKISPRDKIIFKDRLLGLTLSETSRKHNLSRERIRQIQAEVVQRIRRKLNLHKSLK